MSVPIKVWWDDPTDNALDEPDWEQVFADLKIKMPEANYPKLKKAIREWSDKRCDKARIDELESNRNLTGFDVGGNNRTVSPDDDIVKRCVDYFEKHFKNADQFYLAEVENDRWVYFEDTKDWVNLGNNVKMKRKSAPNEQMIERNEG